jgi:putative membrane protein insertion efficiency factor
LTGVAERRPERAPAPLAAALVLALLRGYKILISPLFTGCCRYQPSCADYMHEAVIVHGATRGVWLGVKRLARCHPLGGHGCDPVPPGPEGPGLRARGSGLVTPPLN